MRLPRMTTRRWMVLVSMVALSITAERMRRTSLRFRRLAEYHANEEADYRKVAVQIPQILRAYDSRTYLGYAVVANAVLSPERAEHHAALHRKYERAARYPWLPVEANPPAPEPEGIPSRRKRWTMIQALRHPVRAPRPLDDGEHRR